MWLSPATRSRREENRSGGSMDVAAMLMEEKTLELKEDEAFSLLFFAPFFLLFFVCDKVGV